MDKFDQRVELAPGVQLGGEKMVIISGPCAVESYPICLQVAQTIKALSQQLGFHYIFKASFDKANRTSAGSFRGIGMEEGLAILSRIKDEVGVPVITDVHESHQVPAVAEVVDALQIPAFLCRQTDLLLAAGNSGKGVNIKRGQFMAPGDMRYALEKVRETGNPHACLTERGVSFGYHNLVVDMRALPTMRQFSPVIFDVTHSVQQPGGAGGSSGGQKEYAPYLARAAAAAGVDGFFVETHPDPSQALSDGPNMIPLEVMEEFIKEIKRFWDLQRELNINN